MGAGNMISTTLAEAQAQGKDLGDSRTYERVLEALRGSLEREGAGDALPGKQIPIIQPRPSHMISWDRYGALDAMGKQALIDESLAADIPGSIIDQVMMILDLVTGHAAEVQLEEILGITIGDDTPVTKRLTDQMALLANISAILSGIGVAAEVASVGQIDRVTSEVRAYLDAAGVTQTVGYGYGQILGELLGEPMGQELRAKTRHTLPSIGDLIIAQMRRETYDPDDPSWDEDLKEEIARYGFSEERGRLVLRSARFYPAVQDWIRFAVRDVWNKEAVTEGQYDADFPEDILEHTRRAGLQDETVRQYWRAHWQLPSPQMGYEMLHRSIITRDQLYALLRIADYAPGWIDRMIAISYRPLTRVDARRMYEAGVLSDDEYRESMERLGYSPEDAGRFVAWVQAKEGEVEKDLTLSQTLQGRRLGLLREDETITRLTEIGYDEAEAAVLMGADAAKEAEAHSEKLVKLAIRRYVYRLSDVGVLKTELARAGVMQEALDRLVEQAEIERINKRKLPTKADVLKGVKELVVSDAEAMIRLQQIGYTDEDARLLLTIQAAGSSTEE